MEQLFGLIVSLTVYAAGVWLFLRLQAARIRALPAEWREHPELRAGYDAASQRTLRSVFTNPNRAGLGWLAVFTVTFALLAAADFTLGFELLYIAVLAVVWTGSEYKRNVDGVRRLQESHGLTRPPRESWQPLRRLARWLPRLVVWVGFLGTACFAGSLLALPFR
ncbi:MAG: hypothetical protein QOG63_943 [Thermoleophilaceae bacterium]|jgi:hypothetical protein|nr:hypothetical protein [Thermoleophilaceae bacterium]